MNYLKRLAANPTNWKLLLAGLVLNTMIFAVFTDFTSELYPEWMRFGEDLPSTTEMQGAKAAMLAMVGAAALFVALIPSSSSHTNKKVSRIGKILDLSVRILGAIAVAMAGWFWLLNATNGNPGPYLLAIVPTTLIYVFAFSISSTLGLAYNLDERNMKETGRSRLGWETLILLVGVLVVTALTLGTVFYLPGWIF